MSDMIDIVLCGRGGQGILFATTVIEKTAMRKSMDVIGSETHGMAQRGGSGISHLRIGKSGSPTVPHGEADVLFSLDNNETARNIGFLKRGGACFTNAKGRSALHKAVLEYAAAAGASLFTLDADAIALEIGAQQSVNVAVLGLLPLKPELGFSRDVLIDAVKNTGPEKIRAKNVEVLLAAFEQALRENPV